LKLSLGTTYSPIGIDVGARAVSAVQLMRTGARWRLHAGASVPRAAGSDELTAAEFARTLAALRRQGFVGERAVTCVPLAKAFSSVLELPAHAPGAPVLPYDAIARQELARSAKRDAAGIEVAWWELPAGPGAPRGGSSALAIGCTHADATALLDALEGPASSAAAGLLSSSWLDVLALDTAPTALARACAPLLSSPPGLTALACLTHDAAQMLILRGPLVVYERTLPEAGLRMLLSGIHNQIGAAAEPAVPGGDLAEHFLNTYGVTPPPADDDDPLAASAPDACALIAGHADALANEITASITYAARRFDSSVATLVLAGSGAAIPGFAARVGERSGLHAMIAEPAELFELAAAVDRDRIGPHLTLALGLALHGEATEGGRA
jgi:Tfp pilus assembly PilM family ATPase